MNASLERTLHIGFGVFEVDRVARELHKQGRRIRLQDQPFHVLAMLLDRPGEVVTREQLRHKLWPGSVYVDFDHGLNNAIARLREALGDNAASPQYIETLPRIGYRFIYPVHELPAVPTAGLEVEPGGAAGVPGTGLPVSEQPDAQASATATSAHTAAASSAHPSTRAADSRRRPWWPIAAVLVVAAVVAAWLATPLLTRSRSAGVAGSAAIGSPSIAVLPFVSMSSIAEDEYFADGLTEELSNELAQIPGLKVAGRTSAFHFKGRNETTEVIAQTLKVDHLLEGSVRRSGTRLRVTAQLIDARTGYHLWSETFDRESRDIFAIQDEIALSVASALHLRLMADDERELRRRGTHDAEAYRQYLMGMALLKGLSVGQDRAGARRHFEQAIARDPRFAAAQAGLASYHFDGTLTYRSPEDGARLGRAAAERAFALDPDGSEALRVMADFEMWRYRVRADSAAYGRADALFRRAAEADPTNEFALFEHGRAILWREPQRALKLFERACDLDPMAIGSAGMVATTMVRLGMHEAARARLQKIVPRSGDARLGNFIGSLEAYLGRLDAAAVALHHAQRTPHIGTRFQLWGVLMSLGDRAAAGQLLREAGDDPLVDALRTAATLGSEGRHAEAFEHLDRRRAEFPMSRMLDLPAARFAVIASEYSRAQSILEDRLPDLARGGDVIDATRVLPALDLVLAWSRTGRLDDARRLLERVAAFLDGSDAPRLPMFTVQRARAHALAGEAELARRTLERAYAEGFRMTCALDLQPQPLLYVDCIDADPAFTSIRRDVGFDGWLARIQAANREQLAQLRTRVVATATHE